MSEDLSKYMDFTVHAVKPIKKGFGFIVDLKYRDGTVKTQQHSGFRSKTEAEKAKALTYAELHNHTYLVYRNITVEEVIRCWLKELEEKGKTYATIDSFRRIADNHIIPLCGKSRISELTPADIYRYYEEKANYSYSVAKQFRAVFNCFFQYAVNNNMVTANAAKGIKLPKSMTNGGYHQRTIDSQKTLTLEQVQLLLDKSKGTKIGMMVKFNVLMGLRRSEILGLKYSDVDYDKHTLKVVRQLGRAPGAKKEDYVPKTFTKQEIRTKTRSSVRELPIPDIVYEAILEERKMYEKNRSRRKASFQDLDYICCSAYGRPRCSTFHHKIYKQLLKDCGLPDIRWHDLRATYCTLLLKNNFSPKAVSKLMGHAKEIVTVDVYGDNQGILIDGVPEMDDYIKRLLPEWMEEGLLQ